MRYALIDNNQVEAQPGFNGICPGCSQPVVAKCGDRRINHWAHRASKMCDSWWEPETEWHRSWKDNFPKEWQEVFLPDPQTGEKHIADVRSKQGLVVEFQHSHIHPEERISREKFYKNMVWIVDGTRLKRDYPRFLKNRPSNFHSRYNDGIYYVDFLDECFPSSWLDSNVAVVFDFKGNEVVKSISDPRHFLYCLFPIRLRGGCDGIVAEISRKAFVSSVMSGEWTNRVTNFVNLVAKDEKEQISKLSSQHRPMNYQKITYTYRGIPISRNHWSLKGNRYKSKKKGRR